MSDTNSNSENEDEYYQMVENAEYNDSDDSDGEDYDLKPLCISYDTKSFYMISIYNLDDHFIGVMGIAFNEEYKLSKEDWIFIRQKVGAIGLLLTDYLKTKK